MFTNIDKKVIIIVIAALVLIIAIGFAFFAYVMPSNSVKNTEGDGTLEQPTDTDQEGELPGVEVVPSPSQGGLIICADKCGDGVCQGGEEKCDNLNCICYEDKQECPQDCR